MNDLIRFFNELCLPAKIYLGIVLINIGVRMTMSGGRGKQSNPFFQFNPFFQLSVFIFAVLIGLAITIFGNYLCDKGYAFIVWLFIILPLSTLIMRITSK